MAIYPYKVKHRVSAWTLLRKRSQQWLADLGTAGLPPVETELQTYFVVGCGHTGTTLIAAKLAQHPRVYGIGEETYAFIPDRGLRVTRRRCLEWVEQAGAAGCTHLQEKTPKHIHCIERIRRVFPSARFVLVVRNPLDTCASLFKRFGDLDVVIERYQLDTGAVASRLDDPACILVRYEELTAAPEAGFRRLAEFLDLPWDGAVLASGETIYENTNASENMQLRRQQVQRPIEHRRDTWKGVLSEAQAEQVLAATAAVAERFGYPTSLRSDA